MRAVASAAWNSSVGRQLGGREVVGLLDEADLLARLGQGDPADPHVGGQGEGNTAEALDTVVRVDAGKAGHHRGPVEERDRRAAQADQPVADVRGQVLGPSLPKGRRAQRLGHAPTMPGTARPCVASLCRSGDRPLRRPVGDQ
jgi:hypothetical protein